MVDETVQGAEPGLLGDEAARRARIREGLLEASRAVLRYDRFEDCARVLFDHARDLTGAIAGYVALVSGPGDENAPVFLEDGGLGCTVPEGQPMPIRGLRGEAYRLNKVVVENEFAGSHWTRLLPEGHVGMRNVLFAPLVVDGETLGVIGLANKPGDFTDEDLHVAEVLGEYAAVSLRNARTLDRLRETVAQLDGKNLELTQAKQAIERMANTDLLTGAATRRRIVEILEREVSLARRHGLPLQVAMADLDHFKVVNDTYGHDAGDEVLKAVSAILKEGVRAEDTVGRYGGEEFLLIFPHTETDAAAACVERLRRRVQEQVVAGIPTRFTISFGVATLRADEDIRSFVARADAALYVAKRAGRNRVEVA